MHQVVSQLFLARRFVSQLLTRRQEVQKNILVARKFQEYLSLNHAWYVLLIIEK